jgi:hypothetical protein
VRIPISQPATRRARRGLAVLLGVALTLVATPAMASPPDTWDNSNNGPLLDDLLFLLGVPLAVVVVVTLLTYLPSMIRSQSAGHELTFQDRTEWFGGPRQGVEATSDVAPEDSSSKGGASARW